MWNLSSSFSGSSPSRETDKQSKRQTLGFQTSTHFDTNPKPKRNEGKMERLKAEIEIHTLGGDSIADDLIHALHLNNFVGDYLFIPPSILRIIVRSCSST